MIFLRILLVFLGVMLFLVLFIIFSKIEIKIDNLKIDTRYKNNRINNNYLIEISLKLFGTIKWAKFTINKARAKKILNSKFTSKAKIKLLKKLLNKQERNIEIKELKTLKMLQIKLKKVKLYLSYNTGNINFTSYLTAIIGTFIGILIGLIQEKYIKENYEYIINPIYESQKFLKFNLNCIFNVKIVHIINVIYLILQKRSEVNARASNRRTYDYSHE